MEKRWLKKEIELNMFEKACAEAMKNEDIDMW